MTPAETIAALRRAAEANDELANTETDPDRLAEHVEAARWCREVAARLERGETSTDQAQPEKEIQ